MTTTREYAPINVVGRWTWFIDYGCNLACDLPPAIFHKLTGGKRNSGHAPMWRDYDTAEEAQRDREQAEGS